MKHTASVARTHLNFEPQFREIEPHLDLYCNLIQPAPLAQRTESFSDNYLRPYKHIFSPTDQPDSSQRPRHPSYGATR